MRPWSWIFAILVAACAGCHSVDPAIEAKFQAAQQAFDQATSPEQFLRAAALNQEILDAGVVSGIVLYNQGNAYMRAGQRGRAVACYRQAKRYRPRDPYLDANLRYALGSQYVKPAKSILEYVLFWQDWISYPGKFHLTSAGALLTFIVATAGLFFRRKLLQRLAAVCLLVTLTLAVSAVYDWYRFSHLKHGVIATATVVARKGNSESYQPAFTKPLAEGTDFLVLEQRRGWLLGRFGDSQEGWVPQSRSVVY